MDADDQSRSGRDPRGARHRADIAPDPAAAGDVAGEGAELLATCQRLARMGVMVFDVDAATWTVSEGWARHIGLDRTVLTREEVRALVPAEDHPILQAAFDGFFADDPREYEHRLIHARTGETIHVRAYATLERDRAGTPRRIVGAVQDVTAQTLAERALQAGEARFRGLFEAMPLCLAVWRREGDDYVLADVNPANEALSGGRIRDHLGRRLSDFYADRPDLAAMIRRCGREGTVQVCESPYRMRTTAEDRHLALKFAPVPPDVVLAIAEDIGDRVRAETRLRETADLLTGAEELAGIGSWEWTVAADTWTFSDNWCRLHGVETAPRTTAELLPIAHPDDLPRVRAAFEAALTGEPYAITHRVVDQATGAVRHVRARGHAIRDDAGRVVKVRGVGLDVTEAKRRERELADSLTQLHLAQRIARIGHWSLDPAVGVPVWSDEVYRIYERDPARPPPALADYDTVYDDGDLERFRAAITGAIHDGVAYEIVLCLRLPGRPPKWVRAIGEPESVAGPAGHVVHGTIQDITKEKEVADALARSEQKLQMAMDVAGAGIWEYTIETGAVEWNDHFFTMLGYAPRAFQESFDAWQAMVHPDDLPAMKRAAEAAIGAGVPFEFEYRLRRADGGWLWVWDQGRPVERDRAGAVSRLIGTVTNIDERKRKELAEVEARITAEETSRAKSHFLAATSHELRTPLNAILGFSEMMKEEILGALGSETYRQYAADIHAAGSHLAELVDGVLDLARIEAGRRDLTVRRLDLSEVVPTALRLVEHQAADAGLAVEWSVYSATPPLVADGLAVRQILFNLLSNAIKYTPRGGRVTITARPGESGGVAITVADTGIGIAAEDRARLFRPYARAAEVERRRVEGTGLGLVLVKSLVDLHEGTVALDSAPGRGTTVTAWFPARDAP